MTLYKCEESAKGCSQCLAVDGRRHCGWCPSPQQCTMRSNCSSKWNRELASRCPQPSIFNISPTSGPEQGGTTLLIRGSDLGVDVTDIARVTVNGLDCDLIEIAYSAGRR